MSTKPRILSHGKRNLVFKLWIVVKLKKPTMKKVV